MLGEMAGHADERALLQTTFLASAGTVALRMLLPQLFVFNASTGAFEATPAVDLALSTGGLAHVRQAHGGPPHLVATASLYHASRRGGKAVRTCDPHNSSFACGSRR